MAYDEDLAHRVRALLADVPGVREQRMFGGLGFIVGGHMAVAASRSGGLMARVDPAESDALVAKTAAERMVMRGREMDGWLLVPADAVRTARQLTPWVRRAQRYVATLPPKA
jgi:TfoX/Sxy family transcriptional regulator of competence genes